MATTSLWPIHNTGGRGVRTILNKLVEYAENGEKTTGGNGAGGSDRSNSEVMQSVMGYDQISDGNGVAPYVWGEADLAVGGVRALDPSYAGELTVLPKANGVLLDVED